jgi:hypothetical protein
MWDAHAEIFRRPGGTNMSEAGERRIVERILEGMAIGLRIEECRDEFPIRPVAANDGPTLLHDPQRVPLESLYSAAMARVWLPLFLLHVTDTLIRESLADRKSFGSDRWDEFRNRCEDGTRMSWPDILRAANDDGTAETAAFLSATLFFESGVCDWLGGIQNGTSCIRLLKN